MMLSVISVDRYRDGGTVCVNTNNGIYCIDHRIGTKTDGEIYLNYPEKDNSNIIKHQDTIKLELKMVLDRYEYEYKIIL